MAFATVTDLIQRYGAAEIRALLNLDDSANLELNKQVADAVDMGNDTVGGYVRRQYEIPTAKVPAVLRSLACTVAWYELVKDKPSKLTESDVTTYDKATETLEKIGKGAFDLPLISKKERNTTEDPPIGVTLDGSSGQSTYGEEWVKNW